MMVTWTSGTIQPILNGSMYSLRNTGFDKRGKAFTLLFLCGLIITLGFTGNNQETDPNQLPFQISAPWSAGFTWLAAGPTLGGNYYGESGHVNADRFALDFNFALWDETTERYITDEGALVLSVADGFLEEAAFDDKYTYGNTVVISHGVFGDYCYASRYAHLEEFLLPKRKWVFDEEEGVMVQRMWDDETELWVNISDDGKTKNWLPQGTPIGRVGNTGIGPGNHHLHFAMYKRPKDECSYFEPAYIRFDQSMAVVPEPMNGVDPINRDEEISSTNYPVGYEQFSVAQIFQSGIGLPEKHMILEATYKLFGGEQGLFGKSISSVTQIANTNAYYQSYNASRSREDLPWHEYPIGIVEHDNNGFLILGPTWQEYSSDEITMRRIGLPTSSTYRWAQSSGEGYRIDFRNASMIWSGIPAEGNVEIISAENGVWEGLFWRQPNNFFGLAHQRRDKEINFEWEDSSNVGPFETNNGFSAKWRTTDVEFLSAPRINVYYQGHAQIVINGEIKEIGDSPDELSEIEADIGRGAQKIEIWYWQGGNRPGRISVSLEPTFIQPVYADENQIFPEAIKPIPIEHFPFLPPEMEADVGQPNIRDPNIVAEFEGRIYDDLGKRFIKEGTSWQSVNSGYEQHHWISLSGTQNSGKWLLNPPSSGNWEVYVYIPDTAVSQNAVYTLFHNDKTETVTINQSSYKDSWVSLGTYDFKGQGDEYVLLSGQFEGSGISSPLVYDAVGIKWIGEGNPSSEGFPMCAGSASLLLFSLGFAATISYKNFRRGKLS